MYKLRYALFITVASILTIGIAHGQSNQERQIDSLLKWSNSIGIFNGNVLVTKNEKIIYRASFGFADASGINKLTGAFRFNIGSIAKEFNGVAIMMLKEKGRLSLEDNVSKYITSLPGWANKVTIRNLIQYTSGLPDIKWKSVKNDEDIFNDLRKVEKLDFEPGTNYAYNNNNVFLQRRIVESITGISFNEYVQQYILKPCKMKSSFLDPPSNSRWLAKAFTDDNIEDAWEIPMSGWTFVTDEDLYSWLRNLHSYKLISESSLNELFKSYGPGKQSSLGNSVIKGDTITEHTHHGSSRNFEALMDYNVSRDVAIILLTNNKNEKVFEIRDGIKAILNGEKPVNPKKSLQKYLSKNIDSSAVDEMIAQYNDLKLNHQHDFDFSSENELNVLGYKLLGKKRIKDAIKIFELNKQLFPASANAFDSLGEAYYNDGDSKSAIIYYKKSLELDPTNDGARKMIEKIEKTQ